MKWVGLEQYHYLLTDATFWKTIGNTLIIWVLSTVPMLLLALVIANALHNATRLRTFYRIAYFIPNVTSVVAITLVFGSIFSNNFGLLNAFLQSIGVGQVEWLTSPWGIKIAIATIVTWRWVGYNAIIYLAGLQAISADVYEAAKVDGASPRQTFWRITVPMMRPVESAVGAIPESMTAMVTVDPVNQLPSASFFLRSLTTLEPSSMVALAVTSASIDTDSTSGSFARVARPSWSTRTLIALIDRWRLTILFLLPCPSTRFFTSSSAPSLTVTMTVVVPSKD